MFFFCPVLFKFSEWCIFPSSFTLFCQLSNSQQIIAQAFWRTDTLQRVLYIYCKSCQHESQLYGLENRICSQRSACLCISFSALKDETYLCRTLRNVFLHHIKPDDPSSDFPQHIQIHTILNSYTGQIQQSVSSTTDLCAPAPSSEDCCIENVGLF